MPQEYLNNFNRYIKHIKRDLDIVEKINEGTVHFSKFNKYINVELPNISLKSHQKLIINRMKFMENDGKFYVNGNKFIRTKIGIYSDDIWIRCLHQVK